MARPAKYNIQDLASFAITKNGKCLSSVYISTLNKYTWQCENNHIFEAQWGEVVRGAWCKQCSITNRKDTIQDLKNKAEKLNGECLSTEYINKDVKYNWKCENGHTWSSRWGSVKRGKWCPKCKGLARVTKEEIISFLKSIKNITVLNIHFKGAKSNIEFECQQKHFSKTKFYLLKKYPYCKYCKKKYRNVSEIKDFVETKKIKLLSDEFINTKEKLQFECLKGHKFQRSIKQFEKNSKCSTCESSTKSSDYLYQTSRGEKDLLSFVKQYYTSADKIKVNGIFGKIELNNAEFDIYIPELKLAIEYNGLFYHSDALDENHRRVNTSQYRKYKFCTSNGIRLINIFEDEWKLRQKQTENFLLSVLNIHDVRIGASKCKIKELSKKEAIDFINENHIQEVHNLKIAFGLFYKNNLIGVVAGANHHRINNHKYLVLSRMCFKYKTQIIGGASRLLNALIQYSKEHGYTGIISWSDNRLSTGDVYKKIGFTLEKELPPDYYYIRSGNIEKINKSKLRVLAGINERTYNREQGYYQLWDCGKKTWLLPHL